MALTITDANAQEIIGSGKPVIIDFWATWCGPCVGMSPLIDELAREYEGKVIIGKYNIDEESDLSTKYRIMSIPTLLFFKNGEKTAIRLAGSQKRETLVEKINELLARNFRSAIFSANSRRINVPQALSFGLSRRQAGCALYIFRAKAVTSTVPCRCRHQSSRQALRRQSIPGFHHGVQSLRRPLR